MVLLGRRSVPIERGMWYEEDWHLLDGDTDFCFGGESCLRLSYEQPLKRGAVSALRHDGSRNQRRISRNRFF